MPINIYKLQTAKLSMTIVQIEKYAHEKIIIIMIQRTMYLIFNKHCST